MSHMSAYMRRVRRRDGRDLQLLDGVYDSLGTANTVQVTWTKTGSNAWSAAFANPTSSSDTSTTTGTASGSVAITSNSDGPLASTTPSPATLSVTGWTDGARRLDRQPQSRHGRQD
jgi:Flagellar basal body protein FlaE D2 domain